MTSATPAPQSRAVRSAVDRALSKQREDATREVETILDAALRVAERMSPAPPRVADIVAEAATSNQAFYRYFAGKNDLMRAVFERGEQRLRSYLLHQVEKAAEPERQVEAWIRGVLAQVIDRRAARQSAAIVRQLGDHQDSYALLGDVRALLRAAVQRAGSHRPDLDASVIFEASFGVLRRHVQQGTAPSPRRERSPGPLLPPRHHRRARGQRRGVSRFAGAPSGPARELPECRTGETTTVVPPAGMPAGSARNRLLSVDGPDGIVSVRHPVVPSVSAVRTPRTAATLR